MQKRLSVRDINVFAGKNCFTQRYYNFWLQNLPDRCIINDNEAARFCFRRPQLSLRLYLPPPKCPPRCALNLSPLKMSSGFGLCPNPPPLTFSEDACPRGTWGMGNAAAARLPISQRADSARNLPSYFFSAVCPIPLTEAPFLNTKIWSDYHET